MSTGVKALIGIVGVLVLIGACGALLSGGSDSDKPTAKETQTQAVSTPEQATTEEPVAEPTEEPTPEEPQLDSGARERHWDGTGLLDDHLLPQGSDRATGV